MVHQLIWIGGSIYKIMNATLKKDIAATGAIFYIVQPYAFYANSQLRETTMWRARHGTVISLKRSVGGLGLIRFRAFPSFCVSFVPV
jgi:hypothetical protein